MEEKREGLELNYSVFLFVVAIVLEGVCFVSKKFFLFLFPWLSCWFC